MTDRKHWTQLVREGYSKKDAKRLTVYTPPDKLKAAEGTEDGIREDQVLEPGAE